MAKIDIPTLTVSDNGNGLTGISNNTTSIAYITSLIIIIVLALISLKISSGFIIVINMSYRAARKSYNK
jgi:hypothetical protein